MVMTNSVLIEKHLRGVQAVIMSSDTSRLSCHEMRTRGPAYCNLLSLQFSNDNLPLVKQLLLSLKYPKGRAVRANIYRYSEASKVSNSDYYRSLMSVQG